MSTKQKQRELEAQREKARRRSLRIIQLTGAGVILVALVVLVWLFWPEQQATAPQPSTKQYAAPPPMTIDVTKKYFATFKMAKGGEFVVELFADKAPVTVNNFVFLAR